MGHSRQELSVCQFGCTGAKSISQSFSSLYFVTYSRILISLMRPLSSLHFFLMHLITSVNFFLTLPHLPYASSSPSSSCVLSPPSIHPSCVPSPPSMLDLIPLIRPFSSLLFFLISLMRPSPPMSLSCAPLFSYISLMRPHLPRPSALPPYLPHSISSLSCVPFPSISPSFIPSPLTFPSSSSSFIPSRLFPFSRILLSLHPVIPASPTESQAKRTSDDVAILIRLIIESCFKEVHPLDLSINGARSQKKAFDLLIY